MQILWKEKPCKEWHGRQNGNGYGRVYREGVQWQVHRLAWTLDNGPIPPNMQVCHKCDNRPCFEITHLFLGTNRDNQLDSVRKGRHKNTKKTHCLQGHPLSGENLYVPPQGFRQCKECQRKRCREYQRRKANK